MCGINGLYAPGNNLPANVNELIRNMNRAIAHRGPDDEGISCDMESGIALGHRRLSIIDLTAAGHQPMMDNYGNSIVFNGEIYNYHELKSKQKQYSFQTASDTEVLLASLAAHGAKALNDLNGMFAFAWYNKSKGELMLSRDRAGKKPVYYCFKNGIFAFSSEIKSLLTLPWITAVPDDEALYHFLTFNYVDAPATMFKGIKKLAPGELLTMNEKGVPTVNTWWNIGYQDFRDKSESDVSAIILDELRESARLRMVADVPVGAFLSGGVDSSAVVALMREHTSSTIKTFSVGFEGQPGYDERHYAAKVASLFKTEHHEKIIKPSDIAELMPQMAEIFDEPLADATSIPIYFISKLAREHNTIVVQTGDGADELFAGYRNWQKYIKAYPLYQSFSKLPAFIRKGVATVSGHGETENPVSEIIYRASRRQEMFWGGAKAFKEGTKHSYLNESWLSRLHGTHSYDIIQNHHENFKALQKSYNWLGNIDWMCYLGLKMQIANRYLYRMDRLGMANSIEIRSPFLDYNLINCALSVPGHMKIKNGEPKSILKKSLSKILPHEILYRKKMGFCVPVKEWSEEIMTDFIQQHMTSFSRNTGIFKESAINGLLQQQKNGNKNITNHLWTIYFLMAWFKKWMHG